MSDFIQEVDEEYRRDRIMAALSRHQVLIVAIILAIIGGAGFYRYWADHKIAEAQKVNDRFMAAAALAKDGKADEAARAFDALAKDGPPGYALLSRMRAAEAVIASDPERAASAFDAVANDDAVPASMRDMARLRGAMIRLDRLDPKAFEQRYGRFADAGFSYASAMRELLALAALQRQDGAAANRYLDAIALDPNATAALRGRASALQALVTAGPATPMAQQPGVAAVKSLAQPTVPAAGPAAPTLTPPTLTPPTPSPAASPAATQAPTPPAAPPAGTPSAPVPPQLKPPGGTPPD